MSALDWPLQFRRQYAGPLDADAVFATSQDRLAFLSNPLCYAGMQVYDLEADKPYWVNAAKDGFVEGGGSGSTTSSLVLIFQELDTLSAPIPFEGPKTSFTTVAPPDITSITYVVKLGSASTWTAQASIAALESWIATHVSTETTLWQLKVIVNAIANETSILLKWQSA